MGHACGGQASIASTDHQKINFLGRTAFKFRPLHAFPPKGSTGFSLTRPAYHPVTLSVSRPPIGKLTVTVSFQVVKTGEGLSLSVNLCKRVDKLCNFWIIRGELHSAPVHLGNSHRTYT